MTLPSSSVRLLDEAVTEATELEGDFFRSTELRFGHPDDVVSGVGTQQDGGRFVARGTRAVYMSLDEETAFREVTARKARLGGASQIPLREYPRMTYIVCVRLLRHVDLRSIATQPEGTELLERCTLADLGPSKAVGQYLFTRGIQGIVFPSSVCGGANLVVCRDVDPPPFIEVRNRDEIINAIRKLADRT